MAETKQRTIRLSDKEMKALEVLFAALNISGQRNTRFSAGISWLAETVESALAETVAALEIAAGCASGEEWDELIEVIRPKQGFNMEEKKEDSAYCEKTGNQKTHCDCKDCRQRPFLVG